MSRSLENILSNNFNLRRRKPLATIKFSHLYNLKKTTFNKSQIRLKMVKVHYQI